MRKMLSFLGTGNYKPCIYEFNGTLSEKTRFAQEAIIQKLCKDWGEEDKIIIFLTEGAKIGNWYGENYKNEKELTEGLKERLKKLNLKAEIIPVDIPDGNTEEEIWKLFKIVYDTLEEGDEVYFDITHSFRYLPMLTTILLSYAKVLKNIRVKRILYGNIYGETPKIMDITAFDTLMSWTNAIDKFLSGGYAEDIVKLAEREYYPRLKESKGKDEFARNLRFVSNQLNTFMEYLATVRGPMIDEYGYNKLRNAIDAVLKSINEGSSIEPMIPLLERVKEKLSDFEDNDIYNGLKAVKWCIDHNLIQQGYTLLQESIVTIICKKFEFDELDREYRMLISSALNIKGQDIPEDNWNEFAKKNKELIKETISKCDDELSKIFVEITQYRNNLNHAGYNRDKKKPKDFENKLKELYERTLKVLWG
ncbi:CRISPR-associated protein, TM1812 family [Methanocaldococcus vulcanius M7]|uniref:CRISPR-associated protein, TM1812 family n=1 Tax=Methanocaldococcus vulcanius (strain ATCC 700851 / DSM 12094 / M7) TaxID=579137 RepID=C9RHM5_METVM|nr:TIGR02221 family CRISPR-associated protein [Methanocaldococcus vulcanius]ACX73077.1 CRISPR-associated protein, TM1812 family [Methanocaldococcus vulcanius M7]